MRQIFLHWCDASLLDQRIKHSATIDSGGRWLPTNMKALMNCINIIPSSTAACGWLVGWLEFNVHFQHKCGYIRDDPLHASPAFNAMNLIIIDIRSSLLVSNVSSLTFVQLHVTPLAMWEPRSYVLGCWNTEQLMIITHKLLFQRMKQINWIQTLVNILLIVD